MWLLKPRWVWEILCAEWKARCGVANSAPFPSATPCSPSHAALPARAASHSRRPGHGSALSMRAAVRHRVACPTASIDPQRWALQPQRQALHCCQRRVPFRHRASMPLIGSRTGRGGAGTSKSSPPAAGPARHPHRTHPHPLCPRVGAPHSRAALACAWLAFCRASLEASVQHVVHTP